MQGSTYTSMYKYVRGVHVYMSVRACMHACKEACAYMHEHVCTCVSMQYISVLSCVCVYVALYICTYVTVCAVTCTVKPQLVATSGYIDYIKYVGPYTLYPQSQA